MKKVFAMILALAMILSLAVPAMAMEVKTHYEIKITNADNLSSAGHVYSAYQIFDGDLDSTGKILSNVTWGANLQGDAAAAFVAALQADTTVGAGEANLFHGKTTAAEIADILGDSKNHTSTVIEAVAKAATATVTGDPVGYSTEADAPYTISIPLDKAGYYLVKDALASGTSNVNKDISDFILQVVGDVSVEHKGGIPTLDKQVSETGDSYHDSIPTGIGEIHTYRIIAELPDDYRLYDAYYLEFSDNMSKGLEFVSLERVYALYRSSSTRTDLPTANYTTSVADITEGSMTGGQHLSVAINDVKTAAPGLTAEDAVVIIYKAKTTAEAVADGNGIPNQATIIYSNDPNSTGKGESLPDETNVYPINLNIVKVDGLNNTLKLPGAQFVLIRAHSDSGESHSEYAVLDANKKISKWVHHYEGDGCTDEAHAAEEVIAEGLATILVTDNSGNISVKGLKPGRYDLKELRAPDGYNALVEEVQMAFSITVNEAADKIASITGNTNQGNISFDANNALVTVTIDNYQGDTLPSTGGMGTTLFYVFGGLLVAAAVVLLVTKKRMSAEA